MLVDPLDAESPGQCLTAADISLHLSRAFPRHDWERPHPELADPGMWWSHLCGVLGAAVGRVHPRAFMTNATPGNAGQGRNGGDGWD